MSYRSFHPHVRGYDPYTGFTCLLTPWRLDPFRQRPMKPETEQLQLTWRYLFSRPWAVPSSQEQYWALLIQHGIIPE